MGLGTYPALYCHHGGPASAQKLPSTDQVRTELWALLAAVAHPKPVEVEQWSSWMEDEAVWAQLDVVAQRVWPEVEDSEDEEAPDAGGNDSSSGKHPQIPHLTIQGVPK